MLRILLFSLLLICLSSIQVNVKGFESFPVNPDTPYTSIKMTNNTQFMLVIKSNPSTGYNWYISDPDVLKASDKIFPLNLNSFNTGEFEQKETTGDEKENYGKGGYTFFKFLTGNSGLGTVNLEYRRPWEKQGIKNIKVDVEIIDV